MVCFDLLAKFDFSVMKLQTFTFMYFYFITKRGFFKILATNWLKNQGRS